MANTRVSRVGSTSVLTFNDEEILDITAAQSVGRQLQDLIQQDGITGLLIDFDSVRLVTSSMIGELLKARSQSIDSQVKFALCDLSTELQDLFNKLKLDKTFGIYPDQATGLKAFGESNNA